MRDINSMSKGMPWPQTGESQHHAELGLPDKGYAIKWLVVSKDRDLEPLETS